MGFLVNFISFIVVIVGITFAIFANYPEPPLSPILYQWQSSGATFKFRENEIFYKGSDHYGSDHLNVAYYHKNNTLFH